MWMDLYAAVDYKFAGMSTVTLQAHVRTHKIRQTQLLCTGIGKKSLFNGCECIIASR